MSEKTLNPTHVEFPVEPISKTGHTVATQQIEVTVDGPQQVRAQFKQNASNKPVVYFTTTTPGKYTVNLKYRGEHLKLSPLEVNVRVKESEADESPAPSVPEIPKHHVNFEVDAYDHNGVFIPESADLSLELEGPEEVQPHIERASNDKIAISFDTYISEGTFSVGVKYKGDHIQRSPFDINITPSAANTVERREYELQKAPTLEPLQKHREIEFTVPGRARDGSYPKAGDVDAVVILGEDEQITASVQTDTTQPNSYKISFNAHKPGKHKVAVTLKHNGAHIANSPFSINVPDEAFLQRR